MPKGSEVCGPMKYGMWELYRLAMKRLRDEGYTWVETGGVEEGIDYHIADCETLGPPVRTLVSEEERCVIVQGLEGGEWVEIPLAKVYRGTIAQRAAELLGDGQSWTTEDGVDFEELMDAYGAVKEVEGRSRPGLALKRYVFADGSAIVAAEGGWDIEGATPFSWEGACEDA